MASGLEEGAPVVDSSVQLFRVCRDDMLSLAMGPISARTSR